MNQKSSVRPADAPRAVNRAVPRGNAPRQERRTGGPLQGDRRPQQPNNALATDEMREKLAQLKRAEMKHMPRQELYPIEQFRSRLRHINQIGKAGEHHLNVARWPEDEVSQIFSLGNQLSFQHPVLNIKIPTLFGFFVFLCTGARDIGLIQRNKMEEQAQALRSSHASPVPFANRYAILAHAVHAKVLQHQLMKEILVASNQPFDYYYPAPRGSNNTRTRVDDSGIIAAIYEEVRAAIQMERPLDLVQFCDADARYDLSHIDNAEERRVAAERIVIEGLASVMTQRQARAKKQTPVPQPPKKETTMSEAKIAPETDAHDPGARARPSSGQEFGQEVGTTQPVDANHAGHVPPADTTIPVAEGDKTNNNVPDITDAAQAVDQAAEVQNRDVVIDGFTPAAQLST